MLKNREIEAITVVLMASIVLIGAFATQQYSWTIPYEIVPPEVWKDTTTDNFNAGTRIQTHITSTGDGEFQLADFKDTKWMLTYYDTGDTENYKYVTWDDNALAWSAETNALQLLGSDEIWWSRVVSGRARDNDNSKNEKILGVHYEEYTAAENRVAFMVWDGSAWSDNFENVISDPDQYEWRPFDIAYEENSGRAMAAYAIGANAYYRIWDGSAWSAEAEVGGIGTGDTISWLTLASKEKDNYIICITADQSNDLNATIWNGSTWTDDNIVLETDLSAGGTAEPSALDAVWDDSGRAMVAWGVEASDEVHSRLWDGTEWLGDNLAFTASGDPSWIRLAAQPTGDNIALVMIDYNDVINACIWDGYADTWLENVQLEDDSEPDINRNCDVAFQQGNVDNALFVWGADANDDIFYRTWSPADNTWSAISTYDRGLTDDLRWFELEPDPQSNEIMLAFGDDGNDVNAARWTGDTATGFTDESQIEGSSDYTPAQRFDLACTDTSGIFRSQIYDTESTTTEWENLFWDGSKPDGTEWTVQTRTGGVSPPDDTWSAWETQDNSTAITSPDNRYIQYRAILETDNVANTPVIEEMRIRYFE